MTKSAKTPKLTDSEAWARATDQVRASWGDLGPLDDNATLADLPEEGVAFWDEVERVAVSLGGHPAG